ncbi:MAG TPA: GNAT family N-acetyltransferase, partial [Rhodocyclaceae bacterium]|nr:GNAT family N-acetyltransferase [Rhodocyclaceae bacterium]
GRLLPDGHVGRMAVLPAWRGRGVGRAVLTALMAEARRRGLSRLVLHAQTHAEGFYAGFGFVAEGEVFDDAGLPHRTMVWQVQG